MIFTKRVIQEIEVKFLQVDAGVRYWEDGEVNGVTDKGGSLIPCRVGDRWKPLIDLETGKILNWNAGVEAKLYYKVADDGFYSLLDENHVKVTRLDSYVPHMMNTGDGDSDYIAMTINKDGFIQDWEAEVTCFENEPEDS